ncbi:glycosyltransferase family 2 protein [Candidatus Endoriftia persephonae]|uniref:Glycosyltransferase family 2 protein n=1 Tax=Candidatus Endoriftia persephonae TaxID=393765 RepID=A0A9J6ZYY2_9GAMM|nr:glycosyltransferase family 2 protein [Candidatus Endoriftia persephone]USF87964.1 glycosyltransferase family 2 protein [Candidatus Endoriftia persephone]
MRVSLIVTSYQWPEALACVVQSLFRQSRLPDEIIVADDGSGPQTRERIAQLAVSAPCPLHHVWQPDQGFRAAAIRNQAVARASGDYLIFLDHDCIAFPHFVERQLDLAEPGWFVAGNRLLLNPSLSRRVLDGELWPPDWSARQWLTARLSGGVNRLLPLLRIGEARFRKRRARRWQGARSCNLALWREDFLAVNGFDESFQGWGHEDADLAARLIVSGRYHKDGRFALPVLHLWHAENPRAMEAENRQRLEATLLGERSAYAEQGVSRYLNPTLEAGGG